MNQVDYFRQNIFPQYETVVIKNQQLELELQRLYDEANEYSKNELIKMYLDLKGYSIKNRKKIKKSMSAYMRKVDIYKSYLDLLRLKVSNE